MFQESHKLKTLHMLINLMNSEASERQIRLAEMYKTTALEIDHLCPLPSNLFCANTCELHANLQFEEYIYISKAVSQKCRVMSCMCQQACKCLCNKDFHSAIGKSEQGLRRHFLNKLMCKIFRASSLIHSLKRGCESTRD